MWGIFPIVWMSGFYGKFVSIKVEGGVLYDFQAPLSPSNYTREDNESQLFLLSNHSLILLTKDINKTFHLECDGENHRLNHNKTFNSKQEALRYIFPSQNLTDMITGPEELQHSNYNLFWLFLLIPVIIIGLVILWKRLRKRRTKVTDQGDQQQPLANGDAQHSATQNGGCLMDNNGGAPNGDTQTSVV